MKKILLIVILAMAIAAGIWYRFIRHKKPPKLLNKVKEEKIINKKMLAEIEKKTRELKNLEEKLIKKENEIKEKEQMLIKKEEIIEAKARKIESLLITSDVKFAKALELMEPERASAIVESLPDEVALKLLLKIKERNMAEILETMSSDKAIRLYNRLEAVKAIKPNE